jgi:crotonobetainyl-CoA:carnitine CoA-transferase CaiB-like acyl-CoA transferase
MGPLAGKRILEVGHMLAGPYSGMLLADLGAEVIKIEGPEGDIARRIGPHSLGEHNVYFASLNRNKKSVVLDLKTEEGQRGLHRLAATSHALLTNLRPSAIKSLGLTYDALRTVNPKITCVALTGYGLEGPFSESPAYDYVIQALSGVMMMTGEPDGPPIKPGFSTVDNSAGIMGALALTAKLVEGRGGQVDVSMHDTMLSQLNYLASSYLNADEAPERVAGGGHPYIVPAQMFEARSGYVVVFITHDKFWKLFADALGEPGWTDDPRFASMQARSRHRDAVVAEVGRRLRERDAEDWVERLAPLGLVVAAVQSLPKALDGPLVASRGMVIDIPVNGAALRLVGNPIRFDDARTTYGPPPLLGQHAALLQAAQEPIR